jgi:hypothetical protein
VDRHGLETAFPIRSMSGMAYTIPPVHGPPNMKGPPFSVNGISLAAHNVDSLHPAMNYHSKWIFCHFFSLTVCPSHVSL